MTIETFTHFLSWYVAILLAGLLGLPWAYRLFRRLPDRGYVFSKPLGLMLVTFVFWLAGSFGIVKNDNSGLFLGVIVVGVAGVVVMGRNGWRELREWLREQRGTVLAVELLFLLAFMGWALVRAYNPDIYGTEKPMEYMFLNSILRSPTLPPHDAWLSGYAISYYYFGYFQMAALARLTATPMEIAYNLAQALIFALTTVSSLGVVMNLIALVKTERAAAQKRPAPGLLSAFWPGLLAPLMVLVVANFYAPLELLHDNGFLANTQIPMIWYNMPLAQSEGQPVASNAGAPPSQKAGITVGTINFWQWLDFKGLSDPVQAKPGQFQTSIPNWFFASRVVHDRNLAGQDTEAIDEMPAFSFLLGDLHPHVLAFPFVFLAMGLALDWLYFTRGLAYAAASGSGAGSESSLAWPGWERILLSAVILGGLIFLNTWDFPIYWFLTVLAIVVGVGSILGRGIIRQFWPIGRIALALLGVSLVLFIPFFITFQSQAGGFLPNLVYPTRFQQTFVMFGPLLIGVVLFIVWALVNARPIIDRKIAWSYGIWLVIVLIAASMVLTYAAIAKGDDPFGGSESALPGQNIYSLLLQRRLVDSLTTLLAAAVIGSIAGIIVGILKRTSARMKLVGVDLTNGDDGNLPVPTDSEPVENVPDPAIPDTVPPALNFPAVWMILLMILTGALLLIGPEFVFLRDNFGTRMNTLFKFYFQIWALWGAASAFGVWYLFQAASPFGKLLTGITMGLALLAGLIYLPSGLATKTNNFATPPTLDGMAYFAKDYPNDWAAIQWMQQNVNGNPVILEGTKGAYWIEGRSSRFSMATGLPTVMGWVNHEGQWRGNSFSKVANREANIQTIYQTRDWSIAESILNTYEVQYVIVSDTEQQWYHQVFTQKFDAFMHRVYQAGDVIIYER